MLFTFLDGAMFGEKIGDGKPSILFLHGWRRTHEDFLKIANSDLLPGSLLIDLPGFGASPPPLEVFGAYEYAQMILPILDEMNNEILIVGHSFGGRVGIALAKLGEGRVKGLLLTGVPIIDLNKTVKISSSLKFAKKMKKLGIVSDQYVEKKKKSTGSLDYRLAEGIMRDVLVKVLSESRDGKYIDTLETLKIPIKLIWGENDAEVSLNVAKEVVRKVPQIELKVISGANHMVILDKEDDFIAGIRELVEK